MFVQMQAVGKVERDPELRVTKDGTPHTEFPLAVNTKRCVEDISIWLHCCLGRPGGNHSAVRYERGTAVRARPFHPAPVHDGRRQTGSEP